MLRNISQVSGAHAANNHYETVKPAAIFFEIAFSLEETVCCVGEKNINKQHHSNNSTAFQLMVTL